ncbi:hypothetical protein ABPG72_007652 [Tetrahymena utriculariae]
MSSSTLARDNQKWSIFQVFCCGSKANKKKTASTLNTNNQNIQQSNINQLPSSSQPQMLMNQYSSFQNQNNQTHLQMRVAPNSFHHEDIEDSSSYSSNVLPNQLENQNYQENRQYYPQNHVINIQSNHNQNRQGNINSEFQQIYQINNNNLLIPPNRGVSQFHRRTQSVNVNMGSQHMNSNLNSQINLQNQLQHSEKRLDTQNSHASLSSNKTRYYTMSNQYFKLKTKYAIHEVDFVEYRPTDKTFQSYFTFDCPICYRHFNKILKSDCCDHYLCHYCLRDIYNKARDCTNFEYRCMFCQLSTPQYIDANDSADKIKRYTDSPFITPKDNIVEKPIKCFPTTSQFDHNIHNNLIEFQDDSMDKENIEFKQNEVNIINNCSQTHNINKPPLPHLVLNQNLMVPQIIQVNDGDQKNEIIQREKKQSLIENENVNQSAHKPAGTIPEFQNKYHCNYLQNSNNQRGQGISQIANQQPIHSNIRSIR